MFMVVTRLMVGIFACVLNYGSYLIVLLTVLVIDHRAIATPYSFSANFDTANQSIYGPGPGGVVGGSRFDGVHWDRSGSIGGFGFGLFGERYGAQLTGHTFGDVGVINAYRATGGDVGAHIPARVVLDIPDGGALQAGESFTVGSSFNLQNGFGFQAHTPQVGFKTNAYLRMFADAYLETAFGFLGSRLDGGTLINLEVSPELLNYNYNLDGRIYALGFDITGLANALATIPIKEAGPDFGLYTLARVRVDPTPFLTVGATGTGEAALTASGRTDLVSVAADVTNIGALTLGFPPLNASFALGLFGYNLLTAEVGVGLGPSAAFDLGLPDGVNVTLTVQETGDAYTFAAGTPVSLMFPEGYSEITLLPSFEITDPMFSTEFGLNIGTFANLSALSLTLFGATIGPLFSANFRNDFSIPVWSTDFALGGFNTVVGEPIHLTLSTISPLPPEPPPISPQPSAIPEPVTGVLAVMGLGAVWAEVMRRRYAV